MANKNKNINNKKAIIGTLLGIGVSVAGISIFGNIEKNKVNIEEIAVFKWIINRNDKENRDIPADAYYYNGHYYYIYDVKNENLNSFWEAEEFCEDRGGHLAVINSAKENREIYEYVKSCGLTVAFFGYTDEEKEGEWHWVVEGNSSYENWSEKGNQPNNGSTNAGKTEEDYAEFFKDTADGTWNDAPFKSNTHHFICEWDK